MDFVKCFITRPDPKALHCGDLTREDELFFPQLGIGEKLDFQFAQLGFLAFHYIIHTFLNRGFTRKIVK